MIEPMFVVLAHYSSNGARPEFVPWRVEDWKEPCASAEYVRNGTKMNVEVLAGPMTYKEAQEYMLKLVTGGNEGGVRGR
jgi:hypothetical protein